MLEIYFISVKLITSLRKVMLLHISTIKFTVVKKLLEISDHQLNSMVEVGSMEHNLF